MQDIDMSKFENYEVKILSFWVKKLVALVICKFKLTLTG